MAQNRLPREKKETGERQMTTSEAKLPETKKCIQSVVGLATAQNHIIAQGAHRIRIGRRKKGCEAQPIVGSGLKNLTGARGWGGPGAGGQMRSTKRGARGVRAHASGTRHDAPGGHKSWIVRTLICGAPSGGNVECRAVMPSWGGD